MRTVTIGLVGAQWFTSMHSGAQQERVEVAWLQAGHVGVRDSENPNGPARVFTPGEWAAFTAGIKDDEFTRPTA
ncbi:DUF397 domain-containing protein [Nocardia sp. NPDC052112]|uniref:DUF397 domain-containing protein n=1 Tax=Nocardia sp. NPDC052112 TaxID=3155646 RepID=UPI00341C6AA7